MSETTHNASSQLFYDESIAALSKEKNRLEFRLQMMQENKAGKERLTVIFAGIFIFWTILGVILMVYHPLFRIQGEKFGIYYFVIFGLLLLTTVYRVIGMDRTGADLIANDILEIERKIFEIEQKASHEERTINPNNIKPEPQAQSEAQPEHIPITVHSNPKPSEEVKHCPVCAETVKATAIVCRFCGYSF